MARSTTLKQRFLFIVVPILALAMLVVLYAQQLVNDAARESLQNIARNSELSWQVRQIKEIEQDLELLVHQYTLITYSHDLATISAIDWTRRHLLERIEKLYQDLIRDSRSDDLDPSYRELIRELRDAQQRLETELDRYHTIIQDLRQRFPGMSLMEERLLPANNDFIRAISVALSDYEDRPLTLEDYEIIDLLKDLRYAWVQQVSWFRLFIANRSGIFGNPAESMRKNLANRDLYMEMVENNLARLEALDRQGRLDIQGSTALADMRDALQRYRQDFEAIRDLYMSDHWRADHDMLINVLQPAFREIQQILDRFDQQLRNAAIANITRSHQIAERVSHMIWLSVLVVLFIVGIGYFMFEHLVRRPVSRIAEALHAEAEGDPNVALPDTRVREMDMLVSAFRHMQAEVHSRQIRLQSVLDNAAEGIVTFDADGDILTSNRTAERLFGYEDYDLVGRNMLWLIDIDPPEALFTDGEYEVTARHAEGHEFPASVKISGYELAGERLYTAMIEDISERQAMIANLRHLAEHDTLTGLFNRHYFLQELERLVERVARHPDEPAALMYLDLDNFKYVNDTLGHLAGDQLLLEVSVMLSRRTRQGDLLARLGGDEFALLLYDIQPDDARTVAEVFRRYLQEYDFRYQGQVIDIAGSIGLVIIDGKQDKEELLARADFACHAAKMAGKNRVHLYTRADEEGMIGLVDDIGWTRRIKQALEKDHFLLACQPIVDRQGHLSHQEILLRMRGENDQIIHPAGFIPPAERFGLMPDIDRWVIRHALAMLSRSSHAEQAIRYCINLSAASFEDEELIAFITAELERHAFPARRLIFEVTETVAMADLTRSAEVLHQLKALGCQTALDDFGSGYSSYAYLKDLPVDYVKIDGSFISGMAENALHREIVQSMHNIAHIMGKKTIAEYVENETLARMVREMGIDYLQGFHIGKPVIPEPEQSRVRRLAGA